EFTFNSHQIHKGKLFCFQQLNQRENFAAELQTVLELSEKYRATIREDSSRQAFFANEQVVFDAAAANAIAESNSRQAFDLVEQSKARSLLDFVQSTKSIAEIEKSFGAVARPLTLSEIQSRLPEQVQLLLYSVLPDRLAIWTVSRTHFQFVEKHVTAAELEKRIDEYQSAIVRKAQPAELKPSGQFLYELLIPSEISAEKQLCIVPDKTLHHLAFATLVSPSGKYLLEAYALSYAPSASVLVQATENARRRDPARKESLLSIGNPDFDRDNNPGLPDLRAANEEAQSVGREYQKPLVLLGDEATKEKFLDSLTNV